MADSPGAKPEIVNFAVNEALAKAKAQADPSAAWDVVRQLGQGPLTIVNINTDVAQQSALDPTALPSDLAPAQSVLAIGSEKGPLLVAFTARNVRSMLPPGAPEEISEQLMPALQVAAIAGKEPYAGLAIDPGSENGIAIPAAFLSAGLPNGRTNVKAKTILAGLGSTDPAADAQIRQSLISAVAAGPLYTATEKATLDETGQPKFPLIPLKPGTSGEQATGENEVAVCFGTSPAEIAAAFNPEQWTPVPVRLNEVIDIVRKMANLKLAVINPKGPTLQLPVLNPAPEVNFDDLLKEPTPEPGATTEPDAGTREGED